MRKIKTMKNLLIICLMMLSFAVVTNAQSSRDKMVFSGIKDVSVEVRVDNDKLLNKYEIQFNVETKLKTSNLLDKTSSLKFDPKSSSNIFISIDTVKNEDGSYAYSIILYLDEGIILQRDNETKFKATIFDYGGIYSTKSENLSSDVQKKVLHFVDVFLERYNKVNKTP